MSAAVYYYLLSFLPTLQFGVKPTLTQQDFLGYCREQLGQEMVDTLQGVSLYDCQRSEVPIITKWNQWVIYSRNLIARYRATARGVDATPFLREEGELFVSKKRILEEVLQEKNPRKQAEAVFDLSWKYLDELECGHQFEFENVVAYWLRLQINHALTFENEQGAEEFARACADKIGAADSMCKVVEE